MAAERLIGEVKNIMGEPHFWSELNLMQGYAPEIK
jgi:hypothetical protein